MTDFEIYAFVLCFIVFLILTVLFYVMIGAMVRYKKRSILGGYEDDILIKESLKERTYFRSFLNVTGIILNVVFTLFFLTIFASALYVRFSNDNVTTDIPTYRVVESGSMSYKNTSNKYLVENNLDDQLQVFDLIVTRKLPGEMELELYDIVVYEYDGQLLIHRIVGIEEPNEKHPDQRYFLLQGDANVYPDRFPVLYSQMKAIYEGERYANVGSIVSFFQSPAGYLCILLIVTNCFVGPILEKELMYTEDIRMGMFFLKRKPQRVYYRHE